MKKIKKDKKRMILRLVLFVVAILIAISYIPVKKAVYADKDDERRYSKQGVLEWFNNNKEWKHRSCIVETSSIVGHPDLKASGLNHIGEYENGIYYNAQGFEFQGHNIQGTSPFLKLNASFDPSKVQNYFAIMFEDFYEAGLGERKEGYYELPLIIYDWAPVYPIQRSGTLANLLLPKSYLTIWDFIGPKAVS